MSRIGILTLMYVKPQIEIAEADFELLSCSEPCADDIGSPSVEDNAKEYSVWDDVKQYNNKEERYEDKVHE